LADLAGDPHRHHLRRRHLGLATHPVTSRFPFNTLKDIRDIAGRRLHNQQARTPPIVRNPPPAAMIESRTQTQRSLPESA
jgi:hypothetical protein